MKGFGRRAAQRLSEPLFAIQLTGAAARAPHPAGGSPARARKSVCSAAVKALDAAPAVRDPLRIDLPRIDFQHIGTPGIGRQPAGLGLRGPV